MDPFAFGVATVCADPHGALFRVLMEDLNRADTLTHEHLPRDIVELLAGTHQPLRNAG